MRAGAFGIGHGIVARGSCDPAGDMTHATVAALDKSICRVPNGVGVLEPAPVDLLAYGAGSRGKTDGPDGCPWPPPGRGRARNEARISACAAQNRTWSK
jgi:hypothetical protein